MVRVEHAVCKVTEIKSNVWVGVVCVALINQTCFIHHCWESDARGLAQGLKKKKLISYLIEARLMSSQSFIVGFACDEWFSLRVTTKRSV